MLAAKEWGIAPWEVESGSLYWFLRWEQEMSIRSTIKKSQDNPSE